MLVGFALVAGFLLKDYLDVSDNKTLSNSSSKETSTSDNKIDNRFDTLLIYPKRNQLPEFLLVDQLNAPFTNNDFKGYWSIIFTGYTNCPDVCPNTLNQMTQLYQLMDDDTRRKFHFIFFSVDPERDSPEHLKNYLDYFHQDFIGISGERDQIDILIKGLGGIYSINKDEGKFYTVDHSARIFIVGSNAERYGILSGGIIKEQDKSQLVKDLMALTQ